MKIDFISTKAYQGLIDFLEAYEYEIADASIVGLDSLKPIFIELIGKEPSEKV